MEQLSIRDWMVIIGAVMIAAVLIDAVRRYWRERRSEVRLNAKIDRSETSADGDGAFNLRAELPNGGARIVRRDDLGAESLDSDSIGKDARTGTQGMAARETLDPIDVAVAESTDVSAEQVSDPEEPADFLEEEAGDETASEARSQKAKNPLEKTTVSQQVPGANQRRRTVKSASGEQSTAAESLADPSTLDWLDALDGQDDAEGLSGSVANPSEPSGHGRLPRGADTHVFILYVVARSEEGFSGTDILETLLACDLRFGDMDFFHRHEQASGRGPIEFSVANMMKPGVFDIDNMEPLQTRGLMFFVTLPGPSDMLKAFDYMYETVKLVSKHLDGDIQDETRSIVTRQSLEHMRQQIRELERRLLVRRN